jgi:hypothetical protein
MSCFDLKNSIFFGCCRVARFILVHYTKTEKNTKWQQTIEMAVKYIKLTLNVPNEQKNTHDPTQRPSKICPNFYFGMQIYHLATLGWWITDEDSFLRKISIGRNLLDPVLVFRHVCSATIIPLENWLKKSYGCSNKVVLTELFYQSCSNRFVLTEFF